MSALDTSPCGFACEASDFECLTLWREFHVRECWEEIREGRFYEIGKIAGRPVCVQVTWAIINRQRVAFYHACSLAVDHTLVEQWMRKTLLVPGGTHADAMNFHQVLDAIRRANGTPGREVGEIERNADDDDAIPY